MAIGQYRDKDYSGDLFAGLAVYVMQFFSAKVHQQFLPGTVGQLTTGVVLISPLPVMPGKLAVFITFIMESGPVTSVLDKVVSRENRASIWEIWISLPLNKQDTFGL
ncbi:hypothetical protein [Algoriphagus resistens]|uniref:hypothetical protein n=1 Tax=Algoriphagus resistens TaxID=1750590 RepID=UPI000716AFC9|nr:hypothetical protein [Algoriphagus resistens]